MRLCGIQTVSPPHKRLVSDPFHTDSHLYPPVRLQERFFLVELLGNPSTNSKERMMEPLAHVPHPLSEPDFNSPEWRERHKHDRYKYNRLKYGCGLHGILPSRGPDSCFYADRCDVASDPADRRLCHPGWPCPRESAYFTMFVTGARKEFHHARRWLDDEEFESTIRDLVLWDLQKSRCGARLRDEGFLRTVRRELPDGCWEMAQVASLDDRYGTAAYLGFNAALHLLTDDPNPVDPEAMLPAWERDMNAVERVRRQREREEIERVLNDGLD